MRDLHTCYTGIGSAAAGDPLDLPALLPLSWLMGLWAKLYLTWEQSGRRSLDYEHARKIDATIDSTTMP